MRLAIDIQSAIGRATGVGRYTRRLVEHLAPLCGPDELRLFYFDFQRRGSPFGRPDLERAMRWIPGRIVQKAWKTVGFPPFDWFAGPADVYHFPNFIRPPLGRGRSAATIHDLSFVRFPETLEDKNLRYLRASIGRTVERCDRLLTDSATIARELEEAFPAARGKTVPVLLGVEPRARAADPAAARRRLGLERPYLLSVGTLEPRKNFAFLVEVFEALDGFDGDLVIAGMRGWKFEPILERIARSPRAARIRHVDYPDDELLDGLYAGAELFVFPSRYEGFGFTPLEAMANGAPVVCSAGGSLPEVVGPAARVVPELDVEPWRAAVTDLLENSPAREALRARGREHVRQFAWAETARRTLDVLRQLAG